MPLRKKFEGNIVRTLKELRGETTATRERLGAGKRQYKICLFCFVVVVFSIKVVERVARVF